MFKIWTRRRVAATLIFNLEDRFAQELTGSRPVRPVGPLQFWLVARTGPGPRRDFQPPLRLAMITNPSGFHLFFGQVLRPDRSTRQVDLAHGIYLVRVISPEGVYQTAESEVVVPLPNLNQLDPTNPDPALRNPLDAYTLRLDPGYAYIFTGTYPFRPQDFGQPCNPANYPGREGIAVLRGSLHSPGGAGIAGAVVRSTGIPNTYTTGEDGQWLLWFPNRPTGTETVHIDFPDGSAVDLLGVCVVRGRETSLHQTALRGWVRRAGVSVAGATVAVDGFPGQTRTGPDGGWTYFFPLDQSDATVNLTVTLPDGTSQPVNGVQVKSRASILVPIINFP